MVRQEHKSLLSEMELWQGNFYQSSQRSHKQILDVVDDRGAELAAVQSKVKN